MEYVIVGDKDDNEGYLVYVCGKSKENAEKSLDRMLNNPTDNDKSVMDGLCNFRIDTVEDKDCWWNFGTD